MEDPTAVGQFIRDVGTPVALLFFALYVSLRIGKFLGPYFTQVFEGHLSLVRTIQGEQPKMTSLLERTTEASERQATTSEQQAQTDIRQANGLEKTNELLEKTNKLVESVAAEILKNGKNGH